MITIVAGFFIRWVLATLLRVTTVVSADVAVVAEEGFATNAPRFRDTRFRSVAEVSIIATQPFARHATQLGITDFKSVARILVITHQGRSTITRSVQTVVIGGANIPIIAGHFIGLYIAAEFWIAGIVCTRVPIIAIDGRPGGAGSGDAYVLGSAGTTGITGSALVSREQAAVAGGSFTGRSKTGGIDTLWRWAIDERRWIDDTEMREFVGVAHQSSIAEVPIL